MLGLSELTRILLFLLSLPLKPLWADCPHLCECKWKSGKESVLCIGSNLTSIPLHLDAGTQVLDLSSNILLSIKHDEFSQAGLLNLQKVFLVRCRLKNLDRFAFRNLNNLVELDLSYNFLSLVPSYSLECIPELRELKLSGNPIQRIPNEAFVHVPQLVRLEMSDCKVGTVELKAFYGLEKSLEWLKLDKNKLVDVQSNSLTVLHNLHGLDLAGNPWNCSCALRPLREWMLKNNIPFGVPPVCQYPKRLQEKSWERLDLDEFACTPEIYAFDSKTNGVEGKNVTMTCQITGVPTPNVRWMLKNKVITNFTSGKKLYATKQLHNASVLTILTAEVHDNGVYVCTAENKAGKVEASVLLAITKKPTENNLSTTILLVSIFTGMFLAIVSCVIVICLWTLRKKQRRPWRNDVCRNDNDTYEKIELNNHKNLASKFNNDIFNDSNNSCVEVNARKYGDYCVVPAGDTDQEDQTDDDVTETSILKSGIKETVFLGPKSDANGLSLSWSEDVKTQRVNNMDGRDDLKRKRGTTSGTYNSSAPTASTSSYQPQVTKKQAIDPKVGGALYTSNYSSELSSLAEIENEQKYPDLLENSSSPKKQSHCKANSEGGSINDINEIFCTLPRKGYNNSKNTRYTSNDSQCFLLGDSRYNSSGGESSTDSCRRLSQDSQKIPMLLASKNKKSSSYLNLTFSRNNSSCPSPIHESLPSATPLLDVNSLENRLQYKEFHQIPPGSTSVPGGSNANANTYDYHAAQLERFLEEYRSLQKQLTKMKETCDNLRTDKTKFIEPIFGPSTSEEAAKAMKKSPNLVPMSPNANQSLEDVIRFPSYESDISRLLLSKNIGKPLDNMFNK